MPLNAELKGKVYQEVEFAVDRARVLQFCDAIGERGAVFRDPEAARAAGYAEQLAPPTFATVLQIMTSGQAVLDQELGLNYALVVHGEQEYVYDRPIMVGDTLHAVPHIADIYARGTHEYLVIESEVRDEAGERVLVARTTLLSRGTAAS